MDLVGGIFGGGPDAQIYALDLVELQVHSNDGVIFVVGQNVAGEILNGEENRIANPAGNCYGSAAVGHAFERCGRGIEEITNEGVGIGRGINLEGVTLLRHIEPRFGKGCGGAASDQDILRRRNLGGEGGNVLPGFGAGAGFGAVLFQEQRAKNMTGDGAAEQKNQEAHGRDDFRERESALRIRSLGRCSH